MGPLLLIPCSVFLFLNSTREFSWLTLQNNPYLSYTRPSCSSPVYPLSVKSDFFPFPSPLPFMPTFFPLDAPFKEKVSSAAGGWGFCARSQSCGHDRIRNIFYHWHHAEPRIGKNGQCEHLGLWTSDLYYTANMAIYFSAQWIEVFDVMGMKEVLGGISNEDNYITRINVSNATKKYSWLNHNKILSQHKLQAHL